MTKRYKVYRNLNNGMISIKGNVVVGYAKNVLLHNCKMIVNEKGRQRVLRDQQKNVHAYIEGEIVDIQGWESRNNREVEIASDGYITGNITWKLVMYNPYLRDCFYNEQGDKVDSATWCMVGNNGRIYVNE